MRLIRDMPAALGNYRTGRKGKIDMLIIHVMQGGFGPTAAWFATLDAHASAHFGISVDGSIARYVLEHDTAFHAGSPEYNTRSFGIELEGHIEDPDAFTPKMMEALVELSDDLCANWHIARDSEHIIGHDRVPDPRGHGFGGAHRHTDPGPYFPWIKFMEELQKRAST